LRSFLTSELGHNKDAGKIAEGVRQSLDYLKDLEPAIRLIVRDCYAKSTEATFALQIIIAFGAAISAWFIRERRLGG
jgi:hypothetical protein